MRPVSRPIHPDPLVSALGRLVRDAPPDVAVSSAWHAPFDVRQTPGEVAVFIDLPGVDEDEISIEIVGSELRVSASREFDHDAEDADDYTRLERPYGTFECITGLPVGSHADGMTAKYKRGVLKVRIPIKV